jgi:hypothetical protein
MPEQGATPRNKEVLEMNKSDDYLRRLLHATKQLLHISAECIDEDEDRGVKAGWVEYARGILSDVQEAADAAERHLHD